MNIEKLTIEPFLEPQVIGPFEAGEFSAVDIEALIAYENEKRVLPTIEAILDTDFDLDSVELCVFFSLRSVDDKRLPVLGSLQCPPNPVDVDHRLYPFRRLPSRCFSWNFCQWQHCAPGGLSTTRWKSLASLTSSSFSLDRGPG